MTNQTVTLDTKVLEQLVGALESCITVTTGPGESEQLYNVMAVQSAITAGRANAEPAGWQPIETAPEGTMILCANMKAMEARSWAYVAWIAGGKVCGHRMDMPTHWMPLPTPPKEQQ